MSTKTRRRTLPDVPKSRQMSRAAFIGIFPAYDPQKKDPGKATNRGFVHKVNPTYKPPKAKQTPAEWGREMRRLRKLAALGKKRSKPQPIAKPLNR